jgi:hypothetical protein
VDRDVHRTPTMRDHPTAPRDRQRRARWLGLIGLTLGGCEALDDGAGTDPQLPLAATDVAPGGCPVFHCDPEGSGALRDPLIAAASTQTTNASLGSLKSQGCSGDGVRLTCLTVPSASSLPGTLKVLDARSLQVIWSSASSSIDVEPTPSGSGQVPASFVDGSVGVGDSKQHVRYSAGGAVTGQVALTGKGKNFGLTPISATQGVVSQTDGTFTLIDLDHWTVVGTPITVTAPGTGEPVSLVSPSVGTASKLYAVTDTPSGMGILYSIGVGRRPGGAAQLQVTAGFSFRGRSGASPVVITPEQSGLRGPLVLLHVPGLNGETTPLNRLVALQEQRGGFTLRWEAVLSQMMPVAPAVDVARDFVYVQVGRNVGTLLRVQLSTGKNPTTIDVAAATGHSTMQLDGQLPSGFVEGIFTLYLSGAVASGSDAGQYLMAYQPSQSPGLLWQARISGVPDSYTGAWSSGPSETPGLSCPIAVGTASVTRICN